MKITKLIVLPLVTMALASFSLSCERKTPAEEVGEEIEEANEEIGDAVEDAAEDAAE